MKSLSSFQLKGILEITGSSVSISNDILTNTVASFTDETILLISGDESIKELMVASASGGTLTISQRGLNQSTIKTTDTDLQEEFRSGTVGRVVASASDLFDLDGNNTTSGANTHSGVETFEETIITEKGVAATEYANEAARDAALGGDGVATKNYTGIKAGSVFYNYNLSTAQWESIDTGIVTPDASEGIAGKVDGGNQALVDAGTKSGTSGADNNVNPETLGRAIQKQAYTHAITTGSANTYIATLKPVPTGYFDGMEIVLEINVSNTGASTVNVNSIGVTDIVDMNGAALSLGSLLSGLKYRFIYDLTNTRFVLLTHRKITDAEYITGINTNGFFTVAQLYSDNTKNKLITPSSNTKCSADTEILIPTSQANQKYKEILIGINGAITVSFDMKFTGTLNNMIGQVFINGTIAGTVRNTTSTSYVTFTEDFTVEQGDLVQLYARTDSTGVSGGIRNFRTKYDINYLLNCEVTLN